MNKKILLVDDDEDLLETNQTILELCDYVVLSTVSPKTGLELYKKDKPCMTMLDVKMSEMNGYELFSKIIEFDPNAKVIMMTGHEDLAESNIAKQNGLLDVITKPTNRKILLDVLKKYEC